MKSTLSTSVNRFAIGLVALAAAGSVSATVLTSKIYVDNGFEAYISTSDTAAGTLFSSGHDWGTGFTDTTELAAGTDYYLHVYGYDDNEVSYDAAAFLGQFSLSGTDHSFSNNLTTLLTDATHWTANTAGFDGPYTAVSSWGSNGDAPWGTREGVSNDAMWIWSADNVANNTAFFSTKISAAAAADVPEPTSIALVGLALAGLGLARARKAKASAA
ncbi:MAG: PEP-CTERM sorting domain-containing protein [Microbacteriaceae bacterium]|nr:PEP-CTERM sorting domain-containing protein [Burkholderiaceae bacterium]